jgi:hypothetical protein
MPLTVPSTTEQARKAASVALARANNWMAAARSSIRRRSCLFRKIDDTQNAGPKIYDRQSCVRRALRGDETFRLRVERGIGLA